MDKPEKNPYRELMEQVNLTPEARERILTNVQQADLSPQPEQKIVPFRPQKQTWRRWASLAACLVVVVAALFAVPLLREQPDTAPPVQVLPPFRQVDSLDALSEAVGFPVTDVTSLPFDPVSTTYTAYDEGLAEITYTGSGGQTATYRQSCGTEDNSGDYNLYPDTQALPDQNATLKGQDGLYTLALWSDDTYTYSLHLSSGLSADAWQALLGENTP